MSFIGTQPGYAYNTITNTFSGNDSDTAFTLSVPATTNGVEVFVENVQQEPTTAYTVSGTTLTFTAAPVTGTNNIYVIHRNPTVQTLVPPSDIAVNVASITTTGSATIGDGLTVDNDGATVATFDRATSDGTIIDLQKDGTTVGSIGASVGDLYIGTGEHGLKFVDASFDIRPFNLNTGASADNTTDLGNSTARFKDLYLSGGVYLGGTGAANKLEDYEEGTFTPAADFATTSPTSGATTGLGLYVKVGDIVHIDLTVTNINVDGASGQLKITGLPFTSFQNATMTAYQNGGLFANLLGTSGTTVMWCPQIEQNTSEVKIRYLLDNGNAATVGSGGVTDGSSDFRIGMTYRVN